MATTNYTTLLGLALPTSGDLDGTWGDEVNNAITSLLDSAVAGTTTLNTDADVTLSTTTGASNQARQAIIVCTGARSQIRNITAPAQSKVYLVVNSTTGNYAVRIRGTGPTTGVLVSPNSTALVVWNGSDFIGVDGSALISLTSVSGTDTITATAPSTFGAYYTGQTYRFIAAGNNTGAVTINVNSMGAKAITKSGATALEAEDILSGAMLQITYDGTQFQLVSGAGGGGAKAGGAIYENTVTISANYTLSTSKNGFSVGPITVASGVSVTVPSGQRWVVL